MKICSQCGAGKDAAEFYKGFGKCKPCVRENVRKNRREKREYYQHYDRERSKLPHRLEANKIRARLVGWRPSKPWRQKNMEKYKAHLAVNSAIKGGTLIRPNSCEKCGGTYMLNAHHDDYSKPLDVMWLCKWCHGARHRELNEMRRQAARMCEAAE